MGVMLRRSFLSRFSAAAAVLGVGQAPAPATQPAALPPFQPARHPQDDWFDETPTKHRVIFDTFTADRFPNATLFAGNIYRANTDGYGLGEKDLAVVICVRHQTTPFAFNDAMWLKYGKAFSTRMEWVDPKTKEAPSTNLHARQLTGLIDQGLRLAVCSLTTRAYTQILARETGADAAAIYKELAANMLGNSRLVPAGVVAVTRAQEHGYTLVTVG
jgi:intracellular sulfur oxidation DsrE/DsrF family protein